MASSTYYANSDSSYWPYQISDPRTYDQSSYLSAYHQMPQQPQHSPPSDIKPSPPEPPSLLEAILRHGKEAVSQNYSSSTAKCVSTTVGQIPRSEIPSQSPYTPSSSSDRTSPLTGLLVDAGSQDQYQNSYQYQGFDQNGSCALASGNSNFEAVQTYYNDNNNGKRSPTEMSDYGDDVRPDYPWMKSNQANCE